MTESTERVITHAERIARLEGISEQLSQLFLDAEIFVGWSAFRRPASSSSSELWSLCLWL